MKTNIIFPALMTIFTVLISQGYAQTATPRVTEKQINQHQRIKEGSRSGELTRSETRRLRMRQAKVHHDKQVAKSDGVVTGAERRKLKREQKRNSRAIYRQKHDAQARN